MYTVAYMITGIGAFGITLLAILLGILNSGTAFLLVSAAGLIFGLGGALAAASGSALAIFILAILMAVFV
jgi:hypothetical protein